MARVMIGSVRTGVSMPMTAGARRRTARLDGFEAFGTVVNITMVATQSGAALGRSRRCYIARRGPLVSLVKRQLRRQSAPDPSVAAVCDGRNGVGVRRAGSHPRPSLGEAGPRPPT